MPGARQRQQHGDQNIECRLHPAWSRVRPLEYRYIQFLALDQGPQIQAEQIPQEQLAKVAHLLRKVPLFTTLSQEVRVVPGKEMAVMRQMDLAVAFYCQNKQRVGCDNVGNQITETRLESKTMRLVMHKQAQDILTRGNNEYHQQAYQQVVSPDGQRD